MFSSHYAGKGSDNQNGDKGVRWNTEAGIAEVSEDGRCARESKCSKN